MSQYKKTAINPNKGISEKPVVQAFTLNVHLCMINNVQCVI